MPWTSKQVHLFRALQHGWKPDNGKMSSLAKLGTAKLGQMADEGVSRDNIKTALKRRISKKN